MTKPEESCSAPETEKAEAKKVSNNDSRRVRARSEELPSNCTDRHDAL